MKELRVLFAAEDKGYRARLADADGTTLGVEVPFTPFLTDDDYENLRWYLEDYMDLPDGGAVTRASGKRISLPLKSAVDRPCGSPDHSHPHHSTQPRTSVSSFSDSLHCPRNSDKKM